MKKMKKKWLSKLVIASVMTGVISMGGIASAATNWDMTDTATYGDTYYVTKAENDATGGFKDYNLVYQYDKANKKIIGAQLVFEEALGYWYTDPAAPWWGASWRETSFTPYICIDRAELAGLSEAEYTAAIKQLAGKITNNLPVDSNKTGSLKYIRINVLNDDGTIYEQYEVTSYDQNDVASEEPYIGQLGNLINANIVSPINGNSRYFNEKNEWKINGNIYTANMTVTPDFSQKTSDSVYKALYNSGKDMIIESTKWSGDGSRWEESSGSISDTSSTLNIVADASADAKSKVYGIYQDTAKYMEVTPGKLNITVTGNEAVGIYAGNTTGGESRVLAGQFVTINANGTEKSIAVEAGDNGVVAFRNNGSGTVTANATNGYALYAHDSGKIIGESWNWGSNGSRTVQAPTFSLNAGTDGIAMYAEAGGKIEDIKLTSLIGAIKTDDDPNSHISAAITYSKDTTLAKAEGNVDLTLSNSKRSFPWSPATPAVLTGDFDGNSIKLNGNVEWKGSSTLDELNKVTLGSYASWNLTASNSVPRVKELAGSTSEVQRSFVFVGSDDITIDKYTGNSTFVYAHGADDPTVINGGNITIKNAVPTELISTGLGNFEDNPDDNVAGDGGNTVTKEVPTTITLATESTGIDMENEKQVGEVLSNMASKLTYLAYVNGERNLEGTVEIGEGLTTGSIMSKATSKTFADLVFDEETGQASRADHFYTPRSKKIFGDIKRDGLAGAYEDVVTDVNGDNQHLKYGFTEETNIRYNGASDSLSGSSGLNIAAIANYGRSPEGYVVTHTNAGNYPTGGPDITIDMNGNDLNVYSITSASHSGGGYPMWTTTGIWALREGTITIDNPGKVLIDVDASYYYGSAIRASTNSINGDTEEGAHVIINNDNDPDHAVTLRGGIQTPGFELNYRALEVSGGMDNSIQIKGLVDIETQYGAGVFARTGYISLGGGRIIADAYDSVWTSAGTVDMNVVKDADGNVTAGTNDLVIVGGVSTSTPYYGAGGTINSAFTTADSSMTGAISGAGMNNVWLQNGATWNQQAMRAHSWSGGKISTAERASDVDNLYGGDSKANAGIINVLGSKSMTFGNFEGYVDINMQGDEGSDIIIDNYAGNATVYYEHNKIKTEEMLGGNITIAKAAADSEITLVTDNTGIDTTDTNEVTSVLNGLAGKLFYTGYVTGEKNLAGYVQIAEGLTASSATMYAGDIQFSTENGQGSLLDGSVVPDIAPAEQETVIEYNQGISGNTSAYYEDEDILIDSVYEFTEDKTILDNAMNTVEVDETIGKVDTTISSNAASGNAVINMNNGELGINNVSDSRNAFGVTAVNSGAAVIINDVTELNINAETKASDKQAAALYAQDGGQIVINTVDNGVVTLYADAAANNGGSVINAQSDAVITVNGLVNIDTEGTNVTQAVKADSATVHINGGMINAGEDKVAIHAVGKDGKKGIININVDEKGKSKGHSVRIHGHISTRDASGLALMTEGDKTGEVNIALGTKDSEWVGNYLGDTQSRLTLTAEEGSEWTGDIKEGGSADVALVGGNWTGAHLGNELNLTVKDGSEWTNTNDAATNITTFTGASGDEAIGSVIMNDQDINIANYAGSAMFAYEYDAADPTFANAGALNITSAADGSSIILNTDNNGINMEDDAQVKSVLDAMAQKLTYAGNATEGNLSGYVQIAEGLTASSATMKAGSIAFDANGNGSLNTDVDITTSIPEIVYGDYETAMMSGAKSAMLSTAMMWRSENNDLMKRMGDLRLQKEERGLWAKYYGGKYEMDSQGANFDTSYNAYQLGYDQKVGGNWTVGAAVSYNDGDSTYSGKAYGRGETSVMSLGIYGTWNADDGQYVDLIMKRGKLDNEFEIKNAYRTNTLTGDYEAWGTSISAEYGKRINLKNGMYIDPNVEFTYGSVGDASYTATTYKGEEMRVSQDDFNSLIGRIGVRVGKEMDKSNIFARVGLAHEFQGDFDTTYKEAGYSAKSTHVDLSDTWYEVQLGGSLKLSDSSMIYGTFEKNFGAEVEEKWRIDAGIRFSF